MLVSLSACSNSNNNETDDPKTDASTEENTESKVNYDLSLFPENAFPLFDGLAYVAKVVTSDTANSTERQIATALRTALKEKTKVTLKTSTDFLNAGESYDAKAYEILVGKTKHEESEKVFNTISFNSYGIKIEGNKIVRITNVSNNTLNTNMNAICCNIKIFSCWIAICF